MARRKRRVEQDAVVKLFAARLRQTRHGRGMTQAELARRASITVSYIWRLESAGAAPGIDLVARLADALQVPLTDLLPMQAPPEPVAFLKEQAKSLFDSLLRAADRELLLMLNPLLARLNESAARTR